mgnify:CR=1 FL=1
MPQPTLNAVFRGNVYIPRLVVSRSTPGTRVNALGLIEEVPAYAPRIDHDPLTGECRGLLIEEQRTNALLHSSGFDESAWSKNRCAVSGTTTGPDGVPDSGQKLIENDTTATHYPAQLATVTAGNIYTLSVFIKAAERSMIRVTLPSTTFGSCAATFDALTGQTYMADNSKGTNGDAFHGIKYYGNGWYRCYVTGVATADGTQNMSLTMIYPNLTSSATYTGDGASGIYLFGAQFEQGYLTSYTPTAASAVTRAADSVYISTADFSYKSVEGTLYIDGDANITSTAIIGGLGVSGVSAQSIYSQIDPDGVISMQIPNYVALDYGVGYTTGMRFRAAISYAENSAIACYNGGALHTDTSCAIPSISRLMLGSKPWAAGNYINGHIRHVQYYPRALTGAELQSLTR